MKVKQELYSWSNIYGGPFPEIEEATYNELKSEKAQRLSDVISFLVDKSRQVPNGSDGFIEISGRDDGTIDCSIFYTREETSEESKNRLAYEERLNRDTRQRHLAELTKLMANYPAEASEFLGSTFQVSKLELERQVKLELSSLLATVQSKIHASSHEIIASTEAISKALINNVKIKVVD